MDYTTLPKVDKVDASSAKALVAQSRSKAPDDAPADDGLNLLNFVIAAS
jgi:hypothetical protein